MGRIQFPEKVPGDQVTLKIDKNHNEVFSKDREGRAAVSKKDIG